jgi:Protein of unknown function (DUF1236)
MHSQAAGQKAPSGFGAAVCSILPSTIKLEPVPSKAASAVPALKGYTFAIVNGKLLILNPPDKKIIDVVTG